VTNAREYTEQRLRVARTARWGQIGFIGGETSDIWIALHGYGQLASDFAGSASWPGSSAAAFVFPEALQRFYVAEPNTSHATAPVGASWMTKDARLDDIADNHDYLENLASALLDEAPGVSLHVLGFSQGAATGARWAEARAKRGMPVKTLVVWGAFLPPEIDVGTRAPLRATTLKVVCGTRDRWITQDRVEAERARLDAASFPHELHQFEGGHRLDDNALRAVITSL
jgi:predicted esterase